MLNSLWGRRSEKKVITRRVGTCGKKNGTVFYACPAWKSRFIKNRAVRRSQDLRKYVTDYKLENFTRQPLTTLSPPSPPFFFFFIYPSDCIGSINRSFIENKYRRNCEIIVLFLHRFILSNFFSSIESN